MPNYKEMYYMLFNKITKVIEQLKTIQQKTEELYINSDDTPLNLIRNDDTE